MAPGDDADGDPKPARTVRPGTDRLLLDVMLGKLAVHLRMCGYDAAYALDRDVEADDRLQAIATEEARTLLTRDEQFAARTPGALLLTTRDVEDQLWELEDAGVEHEHAGEPVSRRQDRLFPSVLHP